MSTAKSLCAQSLAGRWRDIVEELRDIRPMRPGSICSQKVKYEDKKGKAKTHGPYPILTFKEKGKTVTVRLNCDEKIQACKEQIANFRRFREKTKELIDIARQIADREISKAPEGKKNSSKRFGPNKKPKPTASWKK